MDDIPVVPVFEDFALSLEDLRSWHGHLMDAYGPLIDNAAHVMIGSPLKFEGHEMTLRASMAVLRVASVISEQPGARAVLWSLAESLTPAQDFRAGIAHASEHRSAYEILTRFGQFQTGTERGKPLLGVWAMASTLLSGATSSSSRRHSRPTRCSTLSLRRRAGFC